MTTPTKQELYDAIQADIKAKYSITSLIGKVVFNALSAVMAAKFKLLYLVIAKVYKNIFVDTAESEANGGSLERYGMVKLNRGINPSTAGEYDIDVTGEIGAIIPSGTTFSSSDNSTSPGKLFILDSAFTFTITTGTIEVRALDLGAGAKLEILDELQVTQPLANIDSFADVSAIITTPVEAESYEDYRLDVIAAYQAEPQGGAKTDYRLWAADADGVRKVYPYVKDGAAGEINIYIEANVVDSSDGLGTPTAGIISDVEAVIETDPDTTKPDNERGRRPMGVFDIHVLPITPIAVDVIITSLTDPDFLPSIKSAIETELFTVRPFVDGADNNSLINQGILYEAKMYSIVSGIIEGTSTTFDSIEMKVATVSKDKHIFENGDIPYIDTVTNV